MNALRGLPWPNILHAARLSMAAALTAGAAVAADTPASGVSHAGSAASVPTQHVDVKGTAIAYRVVGSGPGVPLVLLNRFRGTMDHWDPRLIDRLASERRVILFDQPGFARSAGTPPDSLAGFAASAVEVVRALGIEKFDVLGFSMGGTVALQVLLDHPEKVRRAVIAGSGPGHVPDVPAGESAETKVWPVATKPVNSDEDFLYLFFEPTSTSQKAGRDYLARLGERKDAFSAQVSAQAWQAQLKSASGVQAPTASLLHRLTEVRHPVLVANGRRDIMVPTYASYAMAQQLPDARLVIYPDAGHGFLFQYPDLFGDEVLRFLR